MISIDTIRNSDLSESMITTLVSRLDEYLYPLNDYTSYHLATKNNSYLKSFSKDNPTNSCSVSFYKSLISSLSTDQINLARSWQNSFAQSFDYFYIGSKNTLRTTFFYDYFPSAFDYIYTYFVNDLYIKQVGSGLGSAFLFNTSKFRSFQTPQETVSDHIASINNISTTISRLQSDNSYLLEILEIQKFEIVSLRAEIDSLNKKIYDQSQMTWR